MQVWLEDLISFQVQVLFSGFQLFISRVYVKKMDFLWLEHLFFEDIFGVQVFCWWFP